jgi:hypothetical protein
MLVEEGEEVVVEVHQLEHPLEKFERNVNKKKHTNYDLK